MSVSGIGSSPGVFQQALVQKDGQGAARSAAVGRVAGQPAVAASEAQVAAENANAAASLAGLDRDGFRALVAGLPQPGQGSPPPTYRPLDVRM